MAETRSGRAGRCIGLFIIKEAMNVRENVAKPRGESLQLESVCVKRDSMVNGAREQMKYNNCNNAGL